MKCVIIAEAGVNHNGDFDKAEKLIRIAAESGADYVKFQTFKASSLASQKAKAAKYQEKNLEKKNHSQYKLLKELEIPSDWYPKLINHAERCGIKFLSTAFDEDSIDILDLLNPDYFKIPSGEITNRPYLDHISKKGRPVILSTGMATIDEIHQAVNVMLNGGLPKQMITILHCNTEYPTPMTDVNLRAMRTIGKTFDMNVGYSDHTLGIEVPIAAVALGASVIEKHFTIDRSLPGPDHAASLEPAELKEMVKAIRNIELAISGDGIKRPSQSEIKNRDVVRKSLFTVSRLEAGHIIQKKDLIALRPGDGISPMDIDQVIGREIVVNINELEQLKWEWIQ